MGKTSIAWTDMSWNPIRARNKQTGKRGWFCTKVAPGCAHCYAESVNVRLGNSIRYAEDQSDKIEFYLDEKALKEPLKWKEPQRVFPCSMTDIFHPIVPCGFTQAMFDVMEATPQHEYLCLTKRPERIGPVLYGEEGEFYFGGGDYLKNVRLGVSVANQADADRNIPILLQVGIGWSFFVSYEPAIGLVDFNHLQPNRDVEIDALNGTHGVYRPHGRKNRKLDWIIVGGESGPNARPFDIAWARSVIEQCKQSGASCFIKQFGARSIDSEYKFGTYAPEDRRSIEAAKAIGIPAKHSSERIWNEQQPHIPFNLILLKDRKGENPEEWPEDLRVRQHPIFGGSK